MNTKEWEQYKMRGGSNTFNRDWAKGSSGSTLRMGGRKPSKGEINFEVYKLQQREGAGGMLSDDYKDGLIKRMSGGGEREDERKRPSMMRKAEQAPIANQSSPAAQDNQPVNPLEIIAMMAFANAGVAPAIQWTKDYFSKAGLGSLLEGNGGK